MLMMAYDKDETLKRNRSHSWWKRRTRLEKHGIVLLILAIFVIIGLIIGVVLASQRAAEEANSNGDESVDLEPFCITPGCVQTAADVLRNMDLFVDPCEDFYEFACGGFIQRTPIPDDQAEINHFLLLNDQLQQQLRTLLEEEPREEDLKTFKLAKDLYRTCLNTTAIEDDGLAPLKKLFKAVGGWPALEGPEWNETAFDWQRSTIAFSRVGLNMNNFVRFGVTPHPKNSSRHIITLDQASIDIPREKLVNGLDDELVSAYHDYIVDLSEYFGINRTAAMREVKNMLEFKIKLANITFSYGRHHERIYSYNPMTLGDLQRRYQSVRWLELFNGVLKRTDSSFTYADVVNVFIPEYLEAFEGFISETSKRDQANYAFYQALFAMDDCLPEEMRNRHQQFKALFTGAVVQQPRWSECVSVVSQGLGIAVGAMYVRKHFQEDARKNAIEMVSSVQNALMEIMKTLDWMDDNTRQIAIEKASLVQTHIGYPDEFLDDKKLEEYYSDLNFAPSSTYLDMMTETSRFLVNKHLLGFRELINKTDWRTRIAVVNINAGYLPPENSIQLPAAILQGIFFNKDRPQYMNYGGIGSIIGHEMTHSFDNTGRQYDKDGNQINWWANETAEAFSNKAKCFIEQYGKYTVPGININLNGEITKDENIADNGGIKEAYLAYINWTERNGVEPTLPGLNYTANQMFWIAAANNWCSKERQQSLENDVMFDVHAPTRYRVLVPLSNNPHFAEDFNCPVGSNMNPKHKCEIW